MLVNKSSINKFLNVFVALCVTGAPAAGLNQARASSRDTSDDDLKKIESSTTIGGATQNLNITVVNSPEELRALVKSEEVASGGIAEATIQVFDNHDGEDVDLNENLKQVKEILGQERKSDALVVKYTSEERKSLLENLGGRRYVEAKTRATEKIEQISYNKNRYTTIFASVRAVGLMGMMTFSYHVILGLPVSSSVMAASVAAAFTFIIQKYGSKYLEILGDPHAYTKFYKWLKRKKLNYYNLKSDAEIEAELKQIDKKRFWHWLGKQETLVSYSLYLLTEYPIVLAVTAAAYGPPMDITKYLTDAAVISSSALLSQGIIDSALAYGRRGELRDVLRSVFPKIDNDLKKAGSDFERDQVIKKYEVKLDQLRSSGIIMDEEVDWPQLKAAGQKRSLIEFMMNLKMLTVSILANGAAFMAGGDIYQFIDLLTTGRAEELSLGQALGFGGIATMFAGGMAYKFKLMTKYDEGIKTKFQAFKASVKRLTKNCSQMLSGT